VTRAPNRRAFLAGSLAVPAAVTLPTTPADRAKEAADVVAAAMQARHGGRWIAHVDHDAGFALVRPRLDGKGGAL
jgi:hypothetical protein